MRAGETHSFRVLATDRADVESEGSFAEARDTKLQAQQIGGAAGGGERNIQAEGWHAIYGALMQCAEGIPQFFGKPILDQVKPGHKVVSPIADHTPEGKQPRPNQAVGCARQSLAPRAERELLLFLKIKMYLLA